MLGSLYPMIVVVSNVRNVVSADIKSRRSVSASSSSCEERLDISYQTLTRLKSCPACSNQWTTYKAPKSKLSHIRKCAQSQLINSNDITVRIQRLLDKQTRNETSDTSLLDRHVKRKNVDVTVIEGASEVHKLSNRGPHMHLIDSPDFHSHTSDEGPVTSKKLSTISYKKAMMVTPQDLPGLCKPSGPTSELAKGETEKPPPAPLVEPPRESTSLLAQARSRSGKRNSAMSLNGTVSYSLWDVASGQHEFDYQRSVVSLAAVEFTGCP